MSFVAAETDRRIGNMVRVGRVIDMAPGSASASVQIGDLTTPPLPVGQLAAGDRAFWWMPAVGDQVLVACPSGDIAQGIIVCAIFAGNAPSTDAAVPMIDLAGGKMQISGDLEITGNITITGSITSGADVVASGISLTGHRHAGVTAGSAETGGPV